MRSGAAAGRGCLAFFPKLLYNVARGEGRRALFSRAPFSKKGQTSGAQKRPSPWGGARKLTGKRAQNPMRKWGGICLCPFQVARSLELRDHPALGHAAGPAAIALLGFHSVQQRSHWCGIPTLILPPGWWHTSCTPVTKRTVSCVGYNVQTAPQSTSGHLHWKSVVAPYHSA